MHILYKPTKVIKNQCYAIRNQCTTAKVPHDISEDLHTTATMKETARRRITVTSSLNDISTDQLEIRKWGSLMPPPPPPLKAEPVFVNV